MNIKISTSYFSQLYKNVLVIGILIHCLLVNIYWLAIVHALFGFKSLGESNNYGASAIHSESFSR